jgi:cell division protein FtsX
MKRDYTVLAAVSTLIICAIVTYFGRIYFPDNFHPETVSFFENYWVLTLGLYFVVGLISICLLGLWWVVSELIKDIKSLLR